MNSEQLEDQYMNQNFDVEQNKNIQIISSQSLTKAQRELEEFQKSFSNDEKKYVDQIKIKMIEEPLRQSLTNMQQDISIKLFKDQLNNSELLNDNYTQKIKQQYKDLPQFILNQINQIQRQAIDLKKKQRPKSMILQGQKVLDQTKILINQNKIQRIIDKYYEKQKEYKYEREIYNFNKEKQINFKNKVTDFNLSNVDEILGDDYEQNLLQTKARLYNQNTYIYNKKYGGYRQKHFNETLVKQSKHQCESHHQNQDQKKESLSNSQILQSENQNLRCMSPFIQEFQYGQKAIHPFNKYGAGSISRRNKIISSSSVFQAGFGGKDYLYGATANSAYRRQ